METTQKIARVLIGNATDTVRAWFHEGRRAKVGEVTP